MRLLVGLILEVRPLALLGGLEHDTAVDACNAEDRKDAQKNSR